jgi:Flp pilus assembly protein TadB
MGQVPDQQSPQSPQTRPVRGIHISVQPKTWFGKLVAGIFAAAVVLLAFFLSIVVFAILASIAMLAIIYLLWATHRARRAMRNQVIDGEVTGRDIR